MNMTNRRPVVFENMKSSSTVHLLCKKNTLCLALSWEKYPLKLIQKCLFFHFFWCKVPSLLGIKCNCCLSHITSSNCIPSTSSWEHCLDKMNQICVSWMLVDKRGGGRSNVRLERNFKYIVSSLKLMYETVYLGVLPDA